MTARRAAPHVGDPELLLGVIEELAQKTARGAFELTLTPAAALQLAATLQQALRHPYFPTTTALAIGQLLAALRTYFDDCTLTRELLRQGDDPSYDVSVHGRSTPRAPRAPRSGAE